VAVIECVPTVKVEVVNVATPLGSSVPVPSVVLPSWNVTVPVGAILPGETAATVAVRMTGWPKAEESTDEPSIAVADPICLRTTVVAV